MVSAFPAVLIGGPPHSGKSVFTYVLKQALKQLHPRPAFYVFRAAPDGEGDWFHEGDPGLVHQLRFKQTFDRDFAQKVAEAIAARHLPLLVDVGGKITGEQRLIARQCTHAVLVSADPDQLKAWEAFVAEMGLELLAAFHSRLEGEDVVENPEAVPLRGTVTRLQRHATVERRPAVEAAAALIAPLFTFDHETLREIHRQQLRPEFSLVDLQTWPPSGRWTPELLPRLVESLPPGPIALYGSAPTWAFGTAAAATSAPLYQFDAAWGWLSPPPLRLGARLFCHFHLSQEGEWTTVEVQLPKGYVRPCEVAESGIPQVPAGASLVLSGRIPLWLYTALVRAYAPVARRIALYYPQMGKAVVVASQNPACPPGTTVAVEGLKGAGV